MERVGGIRRAGVFQAGFVRVFLVGLVFDGLEEGGLQLDYSSSWMAIFDWMVEEGGLRSDVRVSTGWLSEQERGGDLIHQCDTRL
ncbi:unnamed protein product [Ilex paraguariensis]|uniref:Uncharacterized protein n=1 Tax=Ilex paraguariensis TaxID=185542 RepID=A0ABC8TAK5_9AQUA